MKIGFDISQTGSRRAGCGFFADTLIRYLATAYTDDRFCLYKTFGTTYWDPDYRQRIPDLKLSNCEYPLRFNKREDSFGYWGSAQGIDEGQAGAPDIIHSNNFSSPNLRQARLVYTLYDLSFIDLPDCTTEENRHICFGGVFAASLWSDMVVAISHYSRKRFLENFPHFPPERLVVAHLGNRLPVEGPESAVDELAKAGSFLLAVGTLEPRKNLRRLLSAYQRYVTQMAEPRCLVLAGGSGWLEDDLQAYVSSLGLERHVHALGYVSDATLRWLYKHCWAFVYPSLYEGFGLPVLEAMGAGAAVITSNTSSLPEVGGDAVVYVDPLSEDAIFMALKQIDEPDCRRATQERCAQQARHFSWSATAATVHQAYAEVLQMPRRNRFVAEVTGSGVR